MLCASKLAICEYVIDVHIQRIQNCFVCRFDGDVVNE